MQSENKFIVKILFNFTFLISILNFGCNSSHEEKAAVKTLDTSSIIKDSLIKEYIENSAIDSLKKINSLFKSTFEDLKQIKSCKIYLLNNGELFSDTNDEKPDEYGFYNGPFKIILKWEKEIYNGYSNEKKINFNETKIIIINRSEMYLFIRWKDTPDLCDYSYSLYIVENHKLKKISDTAFGCDI